MADVDSLDGEEQLSDSMDAGYSRSLSTFTELISLWKSRIGGTSCFVESCSSRDAASASS